MTPGESGMGRLPRRGLIDRPLRVRDCRLFVLATEGRTTEKLYFEALVNHNPRVKVEVLSTGSDDRSAPHHLLDRIALFRDKYEIGPDDELWLVLDVDHHTQRGHLREFKRVCREARQGNIGLAISAPCFELWLLLHWADVNSTTTERLPIEDMLRQHMPGYRHNRLNTDSLSMEHTRAAINRARAMDRDADTPWPNAPSTWVYRLVEHLLERLT